MDTPYQPKEGPKTWVGFGIFFILFSVWLWFEARSAALVGGVVPYSPKATWMSPGQAYAGAVVLFIFGAWSVVKGVRAIRRARSRGHGPNI